jgi:adenylate kinase
VPDEVAIERLERRAADEGRVDDTPEAIARRIDLYHRETKPLVSHYRLAGNLVGIHGDRTENEVFGEIQQALDQARVAS